MFGLDSLMGSDFAIDRELQSEFHWESCCT